MDPPNESASQSAIEQYSVLEFCSEVYAHFHLSVFLPGSVAMKNL